MPSLYCIKNHFLYSNRLIPVNHNIKKYAKKMRYNGKNSPYLQKKTTIMEKILPIHLQEIYFSSSDKKESKLLS